MNLIDLPQSAHRHADDTGDLPPCIICGRPIRAKSPKHLHIVGGGSLVLSPADDEEYTDTAADMGYHPVGAGCLKKHPQLKAYAILLED